MSASPIEADADRLLAANPSREYPFLTAWKWYSISKHEVCVDPNYLSLANTILDKEQRVDTLAHRERERARNVKAVQRSRVGTNGSPTKKQREEAVA